MLPQKTAPLSVHWLEPKVQSLPSFLTTCSSQINIKFLQFYLQNILILLPMRLPSKEPLCLTWTAPVARLDPLLPLLFWETGHSSLSGWGHARLDAQERTLCPSSAKTLTLGVKAGVRQSLVCKFFKKKSGQLVPSMVTLYPLFWTRKSPTERGSGELWVKAMSSPPAQ